MIIVGKNVHDYGGKMGRNKEKKQKSKPKSSEEFINQMIARKKIVIKISIIAIVLIIVLLILSTAFAISVSTTNKIIDGISIGNIDMSGKDKDEACGILTQKLQERQNLKVKLKYQDYEKDISMEQLDIKLDVEKVVDEALSKGRDSNIFANNFKIIKNRFRNENIELPIQYDKEELEKIISETGLELPGGVNEYTYSVEENELIISSGTDGIVIDGERMVNSLTDEIMDLSKDIPDIKEVETEEKVLDDSLDEEEQTEQTVEEKTITKKVNQIDREIFVKNQKAKAIDIDQIYSEIHSEPEDAYIVDEPFQVVVDKDGIDLGISLEEAKAIVQEPKEEYVIPLKITKANTTVADLGPRAFPNLLSTYTTRYDAGNVSRTTNLSIACSKINGYVVSPGEVFSYNKVLGKRTSENGYKEAAVYVAGGVENGLGGGICQISTTLYNAVLLANLGIEERHNHSYTTTYSEPGKDATVSYGVLDFKFKNTRKYPIKLEAYIKSGVATVSVYGIKEDPEYNIKIVATTTATIPAPEEKQEDPNLPEGTEQVVTRGTSGARSVTYKYMYSQSGELISKTQLSADTYGTIKRVVKVGTKKVEKEPEKKVETAPELTPKPNNQTPAPTVTPTPTVTPQQPTPEPTQAPVQVPTSPQNINEDTQ